jgi:hypothetical protein
MVIIQRAYGRGAGKTQHTLHSRTLVGDVIRIANKYQVECARGSVGLHLVVEPQQHGANHPTGELSLHLRGGLLLDQGVVQRLIEQSEKELHGVRFILRWPHHARSATHRESGREERRGEERRVGLP